MVDQEALRGCCPSTDEAIGIWPEAGVSIASINCKTMKIIPIAVLNALLAISANSFAQTAGGASPDLPQTAPAAGAIIMPPSTDPGLIKRPPENVDPGVIAVPPANVDPGVIERPPTDTNPRGTSERKGGSEEGGADNPDRPGTREGASGGKTPTGLSEKTTCRGPASLCKQNSAR